MMLLWVSKKQRLMFNKFINKLLNYKSRCLSCKGNYMKFIWEFCMLRLKWKINISIRCAWRCWKAKMNALKCKLLNTQNNKRCWKNKWKGVKGHASNYLNPLNNNLIKRLLHISTLVLPKWLPKPPLLICKIIYKKLRNQ